MTDGGRRFTVPVSISSSKHVLSSSLDKREGSAEGGGGGASNRKEGGGGNSKSVRGELDRLLVRGFPPPFLLRISANMLPTTVDTDSVFCFTAVVESSSASDP